MPRVRTTYVISDSIIQSNKEAEGNHVGNRNELTKLAC